MRSLPANAKPHSVLVIDPSPHFSQILKSFLHQCGFQAVILCDNTRDALGIIARVPVHVVFCDINAKPGGGLQFLKSLRTPGQAFNAKLPVIMMAERARSQQVFEARDSGANEFLAKPVSQKMVERVLRSCFVKPRPFIEAEAYTGPDRRRQRLDVSLDRRGEEGQMQEDQNQTDYAVQNG